MSRTPAPVSLLVILLAGLLLNRRQRNRQDILSWPARTRRIRPG